jgi:hypothetical protein
MFSAATRLDKNLSAQPGTSFKIPGKTDEPVMLKGAKYEPKNQMSR